jgi:peptidyl-prolyl cis-trans isomerase D
MPPAVVTGAFATPKDGVSSAEGKEATERIVFHVTDISVPAFDAASPEGRKIDEAMRRSITEDLLAQYVARLQNDLGATINMDAVRRSVSGGSEY